MENLEQSVVKKKVALVAAYGTLRHGHGNWGGLLKGRSNLIGTFKTEPKYTMYGKNSGFPVVVDKGTTAIEYDLFEVEDENTLRRVDNLEGCTGIQGHVNNWYDFEMIDTEHGPAKMYVQHLGGNPDNIIESGNWNDR